MCYNKNNLIKKICCAWWGSPRFEIGHHGNEDGFLLIPSWNTWLSVVKSHVLHLWNLNRRIDGQTIEWLEMMKEKLDAQFDYTMCFGLQVHASRVC